MIKSSHCTAAVSALVPAWRGQGGNILVHFFGIHSFGQKPEGRTWKSEAQNVEAANRSNVSVV